MNKKLFFCATATLFSFSAYTMQRLTYKACYFEDDKKYDKKLVELSKDKELCNKKTLIHRKLEFDKMMALNLLTSSIFNKNIFFQPCLEHFQNLQKNTLLSLEEIKKLKNVQSILKNIIATSRKNNQVIEKKELIKFSCKILKLLGKEYLYNCLSVSITEPILNTAIKKNHYEIAQYIVSIAPKLVNWIRPPDHETPLKTTKKKSHTEPDILNKFAKLFINNGARVHKSFFETKESDNEDYKKEMKKLNHWYFNPWLMLDPSQKNNHCWDLKIVCKFL